ncbi:MAG: response regulator [Desulfobacterales bacterium]|jgi:signal transduction histidine kinase
MNINDNNQSKTVRLLLVDDEDRFRLTLAKRLAKRGIASDQAANASECLSILKKKPMDVVVLDVKMPGMSGIEALRHIKDNYPKTEVILLTGHATTPDGVEGIKAGAFDYLMKPVELEHLYNKILQADEKIRRIEAEQKEIEYRKKIEQQMIVTERLASIGTLAAGVAHEINNPLAIIRESSGWMKQLLAKKDFENVPRRQDLENALNKIEKSIQRASRITHQLLGFVRKPDHAISEVDLAELMQEAVQLIEHETKKRNITILRKTDCPPVKIWSAPSELRQVFLNLLTNAVHAIGSNGSITISMEDKGEHLGIWISDSGKGIPKENMNKIFEPFFSTKSPGQGTGLGLFITRGIVEKLGGTIKVESTIGQGARFCIRLPKHHMNAAESVSTIGANLDNIIFHLQNENNQEKKSS